METDALSILEKVNAFYTTAWDKLIITGSIALAIVGIIVPLLINWWQKRTIRLQEDKLNELISKKITELEDKLKKDFATQTQAEVIKLKTQLEMIELKAKGMTMHVQAWQLLERGNIGEALVGYFKVAECYNKTDDMLNLGRVLHAINHNCLMNITKTLFDDFISHRQIEHEKILKEIEQTDTKGIFRQEIQDIRHKITKLLPEATLNQQQNKK